MAWLQVYFKVTKRCGQVELQSSQVYQTISFCCWCWVKKCNICSVVNCVNRPSETRKSPEAGRSCKIWTWNSVGFFLPMLLHWFVRCHYVSPDGSTCCIKSFSVSIERGLVTYELFGGCAILVDHLAVPIA